MNSFVHKGALTYHPEMTESVLPTNYALQYTKDTLYSPRFSLRWIHMRDSSTTSTIPNSFYNVQPSSHKTKYTS